MKEGRLDPGRSILQCFTLPELGMLARRQKLAPTAPRSRAEAVRLITAHLDLAGTVDAIRTHFSRPVPPENTRLDSGPPRHGEAEVLTHDELRLEQGNAGTRLRLSSTQLFLENLWPVLACTIAAVRADASAIDAGTYELRSGRLRLKLARAGLISFRIEFLRLKPRTRQPQYLLEPIA
uniref:Uncharacterized protein n=1 Tax=candidate division WOR-3 bacterium TaxID=2052148 RepID=A0A7C4G925_UNCW3